MSLELNGSPQIHMIILLELFVLIWNNSICVTLNLNLKFIFFCVSFLQEITTTTISPSLSIASYRLQSNSIPTLQSFQLENKLRKLRKNKTKKPRVKNKKRRKKKQKNVALNRMNRHNNKVGVRVSSIIFHKNYIY